MEDLRQRRALSPAPAAPGGTAGRHRGKAREHERSVSAVEGRQRTHIALRSIAIEQQRHDGLPHYPLHCTEEPLMVGPPRPQYTLQLILFLILDRAISAFIPSFSSMRSPVRFPPYLLGNCDQLRLAPLFHYQGHKLLSPSPLHTLHLRLVTRKKDGRRRC